MKTLVIIPALNEADSIERVIQMVRRSQPDVDVLVVNDGSTDNTSVLARDAGAIVLDMPYNVGIGAAMQAGYIFADEMGYDAAVQVDGDGQHPARHMHKLLRLLEDDECDMAVASRYVEKTRFRSSVSRRVGMVILAKFISSIVRQRVTDSTSGYRAANRRVIHFFAHHYPHDYPEPEVLVLLHKAGYTFKECAVPMRHRRTGVSSISLFKGFYYVAKVMLAIFVDLFKEVPRMPDPKAPRRPVTGKVHQRRPVLTEV